MKNLELENYGVQEMRAGEMSETDGGNFWYGVLASAVAGFIYECANDWSNNVAAFKRGMN